MKLDVTGTAVITTYSIVLISLGFLLGCTFFEDYFKGVKWTDVVSAVGALIAGFATMGAAYFALKALSTWQVQFRHSERYKAIIILEKSYYQLVSDFRKYNDSDFWSKSKEGNNTVLNKNLEQLVIDRSSLKHAWEDSLAQSREKLNWAMTFLTEEEKFHFKDVIDHTEVEMKRVIGSCLYNDQKEPFSSVIKGTKREFLNLREHGIKS